MEIVNSKDLCLNVIKNPLPNLHRGGVFLIYFFLLPLSSFPPQDQISASGCNACLEDKQAQVKPQPVSLLRRSRCPRRACPILPGSCSNCPRRCPALEPVCSPLPDERQLCTGLGLFCLKTYQGLPRERECKEKSQIKPEPRSPFRRTLFAPYVLQFISLE